MPRAKIETAFLGAYTITALDAATDSAAAWLIHALTAWILRDELPLDIPPEYAPAWAVIRSESERVHAIIKEGEDARVAAAKAAAAARWMRTDANAYERMRTDANAMRSDAREREEEKEEESSDSESTEPKPKSRARAMAGKPASDSASASDSVDVESDSSFFLLCSEEELVPAALRLVREEGNARMRGRLAKFRREQGADAFRDELNRFAAELRAGEEPANRGRTLNARLTALETAGTISSR